MTDLKPAVDARNAPDRPSPLRDSGELQVATRYYLRLLDQVQAQGAEREQLLLHANIDRVQLNAATLTLAQAAALVVAAQRLTADPHLGFALGQSLRPSDHQLLGYALLSSPDLGQALTLAARYWRLLTPVYSMHVALVEDQLLLRWKPLAMLPAALERLHGEAIVAGMHNELRLLLGHPPGGDLWLPAAWLRAGNPYTGLRPTRCHRLAVDDSELRWHLPAKLARQTLQLSDPAGLERARARCDELLQGLTDAGSIAQWLRLMVRQAEDHLPTQSELAAMLNLSTRSLHRRLRAEGASFARICLDERMAKARRLLRESRQSLSEIAYGLGYTDSANFCRAFSRHCGISPGRYRARAAV